MRLGIRSLRFPGGGVLGSLRVRLGAAVFVSAGLLLVLLLGYLMAVFESASHEASRGELLGIARSFSDDFGAGDLAEPAVLTRRIERLETINPTLSGVAVYRLDERGRGVRIASTERGGVLTQAAQGESYERRGAPVAPVSEADVRAIRTGRPEFEDTHAGGDHLAVLGFPVLGSGERPVAGLRLYDDLDPSDVAIARQERLFGFFLFAGVTLLALLIYCLVDRSVLRPLHHVRQATQRMRQGERGIRLEWDRDDEIGVLAQDFDEMAAAQDERDVLEAKLQQSQRLESLGQLAGGVAHDFNNSLAVILNYAAFVRSEIPDEKHELKADIDEIRRAAEHAAALTHQLLIFSRREVVKPEILDLNLVLAETERLLQRTLGDQVSVATERVFALWNVEADRSQIEHLLVNLAVNARDAMPGGGALKVSVENLVVKAGDRLTGAGVSPGYHVLLRVTDDGTGMDAETSARAFDPFFTTKPRGEGTGLGLATVYGTVTRAGGHIELTSSMGGGTTVSIYFPAARSENLADGPPRPAPPPAPRVEAGERTILIVEDEPAVLRLSERVLCRAGHQVLKAEDAAQALATLEEHGGDVDLLLTDVVLPGPSGKELADVLAETRPDLRVIFMSGYTDDAVLRRGVGQEGVPFLQKPFEGEDLLEMVERVLDGHPREESPGAVPLAGTR